MTAQASWYQDQLQQLLPPGRAITRELDATISKLLLGLSHEFVRVEGRAADLVEERDPSTVTEAIDGWERSLGLPDCDAPTTLSGRRAALLAKIRGITGQDIAAYVEFAEALGYTDARGFTRPFTPFEPGSFTGASLTNMGQHNGESLTALVKGAGWPYVWILDVVVVGGEYTFEEASEFDPILECQVGQINQDHAIVWFYYRLFASDDAAVTVTHAAALNLYHPESGEPLEQVAIDDLPTVTVRGTEMLWVFDDGADPVDIEYSDIPEQMVAHGWHVTLVPAFGSDDADDHAIFTLGDSSISRLELVPYSATQMVIQLWETNTVDSITGYTLVAESLPLTFRSSDRLEVTVDGQTGEITVYGAREGDGSNEDAFLWNLRDTGTLHIGKDS